MMVHVNLGLLGVLPSLRDSGFRDSGEKPRPEIFEFIQWAPPGRDVVRGGHRQVRIFPVGGSESWSADRRSDAPEIVE